MKFKNRVLAVMGIFLFFSMTSAANYLNVGSWETKRDTVVGTDTNGIITDVFEIHPKYLDCSFVLHLPGITGDGSDSVKLALVIKGYDKYGNFLSNCTPRTGDTLKDSLPKCIPLPINSPFFMADKYRIGFRGYTGNGGNVFIKKGRIYAVREVVHQRN